MPDAAPESEIEPQIEPQIEPTGTAPAAGGRRSWRDDPLSTFLAIAAVLLGLMYYLEQRDVSTLEDAAARAHELGASSLNIEGCTAGTASTDGKLLVLSCSGPAEAAAQAAATRTPDLSGFEGVLFVGSDGQLDCSTTPTGWPADCKRRPNPVPAKN